MASFDAGPVRVRARRWWGPVTCTAELGSCEVRGEPSRVGRHRTRGLPRRRRSGRSRGPADVGSIDVAARFLGEVVEWLFGLDDITYDQVAAGIDVITADELALAVALCCSTDGASRNGSVVSATVGFSA